MGGPRLPELRKDPITGRWVIIATERAKRPSDFSREQVVTQGKGFCPFDAGNEQKTPPEILAFRPGGGGANESGWTLRVVPNKFPVLRVEGELHRQGQGLYDQMNGIGAHEVIIETPDHMVTLAGLPEKRIEDVLWAFRDRILDLKKDGRLRYILVFKNHGEAAGASLEHSHSQLIALPVVPKRVQEELDGSKRYFDFKERCVYCDIVRQELETNTRVVIETDRFLVIEPFAPRFPFETWIVPRTHQAHFEGSEEPVLANLAWVLRAVLLKMEKVLEHPPYNLIIHTAPVQEGEIPYYHWHIEIIPKLTKVAGFEWGAGFYINPSPPEEAAKFLRDAEVL
jgi:UDPglucose--hexose-1-phosphate uridylyltransferase